LPIHRHEPQGLNSLDYPTGVSTGPDMFSVIADCLDPQGLRLRREKAMLDHIVIESIDRMPTEN
jgi:uncharacterized protein (TIGR03435 family)